jgi:hypothetical protein
MFIPDPNFSITDPGSMVKKTPDPGSSQKDLSIFYPNLLLSSWKHHSGCLLRIPDPGVKKAPDPGSATLALRPNSKVSLQRFLNSSISPLIFVQKCLILKHPHVQQIQYTKSPVSFSNFKGKITEATLAFPAKKVIQLIRMKHENNPMKS